MFLGKSNGLFQSAERGIQFDDDEPVNEVIKLSYSDGQRIELTIEQNAVIDTARQFSPFQERSGCNSRHLMFHQPSIEPAAGDKSRMGAELDDPAGLQHQNQVRRPYRRKPVGDDDRRPVRHQRVERPAPPAR